MFHKSVEIEIFWKLFSLKLDFSATVISEQKGAERQIWGGMFYILA